ncbi:DUF6203 family protein [Nonomuraea insulae]|uniref:DUF6203 family protein n=1 Tax=Nonomuraea insulae TaxID=1616787 RepID=A0ABW1CZG3_9ACTN
MMKLLKLLVARRLAVSPMGLVVLGLGWFLARRRKRQLVEREGGRAAHESGRAGPKRERMVRAGRH